MKYTFYKLVAAVFILVLGTSAQAQLITTIAGTGVAGANAAGGSATAQQLNGPVGICFDYSYDYSTTNPIMAAYPLGVGKLFIADSNANLVRVVDIATGAIIIFAGGSTTGMGDGKPATAAGLDRPTGVSADGMGNVFIADLGNKRIRMVNPAGIISTVAGNPSGPYGDGGFATAAKLNEPYGVKAVPGPAFYITDRADNVVRYVNVGGVISTVAGINGPGGYLADGGPATAAEFNHPAGVAVNSSTGSGAGDVYVSDRMNHVIRRIASGTNIISTIAGNHYPGYFDGPLTSATTSMFRSPSGIAYVPGAATMTRGRLYITDSGNNVIRVWLEGNKETRTIAGTGGPLTFGSSNGTGAAARFYHPMGVCAVNVGGSNGNDILYVADRENNTIRKIVVPLVSDVPASLSGVVTTVAGTAGSAGSSGDGGAALTALLNAPQGVAYDNSGDVIIADAGNNVVRKITLGSGIIDLIAGTYGSGTLESGDAGMATAAKIPNPTNVTVNPANGKIYVTSTMAIPATPLAGNRVREIDPVTGKIDTFYAKAGTAWAGDNILGNSMTFKAPEGIAFNATGDLLIAATGDNKIGWLIKSAHPGLTPYRSYLYAGNGLAGYGGFGSYELLNGPTNSVTVSGNNVYIADRLNHVVRKLDSRKVMSTFMGVAKLKGYKTGSSLDDDTLSFPSSVAYHNISQTLYVADEVNNVIRKIDLATGTEGLYAGIKGAGGYVDNLPGLSCKFNRITGIEVDASTGDLYVADAGNNVIRKIATGPGNFTTTVAGTGIGGLLGGGGPATAAQMDQPYSVVTDTFNNVYVADRNNHIIRKINKFGIITTYAGTGVAGFTAGPATTATLMRLSGPTGVAMDDAGNLYICDQGNNRIRKVDAVTKVMSVVAGTGATGSADGAAASATFYYPTSVTVNKTGSIVYVADGNNNKVRKITGGTVSIVAGTGVGSFSGDGGAPTSATMNDPKSMCLDPTENFLYIADFLNNRVRMVDIAGAKITTVAGNGMGGYSGDGVIATTTSLSNPAGVVLDKAGNLYISDFSNNRIRKVNATTNLITTFAGLGTAGYSGDGGDAVKAELFDNFGIALDTAGSLFIADRNNNVVRKVTNVLLARISSPVTFACQDSCILFTNNSVGAVDSIRWMSSPTGPNITNPTKDTTTICFPAAGTYVITLHIYQGTKDSSASIIVDVSGTPHPPVIRTSAMTLEVFPVSPAYLSFQWYTGSTPIPGAVLPAFTATSLGAYSVEVDSNGCKGMTTYTLVSTTTVTKVNADKNKFWLSQQGQDNNSAMIYSGRPLDEALTVTMYDATGRSVMENTWSKGSNHLQIKAETLAPGAYIIKLTSNNTSEVLRWLKY